MAELKATPGKRKRFGCSPGCLICLVAIVVGLSVAAYFGMRPINAAKRIEQDLIDRHAAATAYVPAPDGAIAADRMEIFLDVRTRLLKQTGHTQATFARINEVDQQENLSTREGLGFLKNVFGALPRMVEFFSARNSGLLAHGMGLGEYFYIYVLAYGDQLCPPDETGRPPDECAGVTGRMTRELTQMLRNQRDNPAHPPADEIAEALGREIAMLENGDHTLPWQGDRPETIKASLAPYRERLDRLFCSATQELELVQKNKNPGGIGD